jgi:HMG (high mobility group) box
MLAILVRRPRQADLSKHISLEWKSLTDEEKAPFVRMSEEAKLVHAQVYPGYKYQPKRKGDGGSTKKSSLRVDASKKKTGKTKKSGKSSKVKKDEPRETELPADLSFEENPGDLSNTTIRPIAEIELSNLDGLELGNDDSEDSPGAGDPSKEWTWLPEQTLLPITWEEDLDFGSANVMHPLDANVEEGNEDENEFRVIIFYTPFCVFDLTCFSSATILSLVAPFGAPSRGPDERCAILFLPLRAGVRYRPFPEFRLSSILFRVSGRPSGCVS